MAATDGGNGKIRILMVSMDYPPRIGGLANHVYELAHALQRLGHDVEVLTRLGDRRTRQLQTAPNPAELVPQRIRLPLPGFLQGLKIQRDIDKLLLRAPFDLVHLHGLRCLEYCRRRPLPQVFTNHSSGFLARLERGERQRRKLVRLFRHLDLLLAPSRELLQIPGDNPPPQRRFYVPNGIRSNSGARDPKERARLRAELGLKDDQLLAIATRRMVPKNGLIHLAKAMGRVQNRSLRLLLIGDGPDRPAVEAELGAGFAGRFFSLGALPREELLPWYGAADLCVLPSLKEATSISGLEAMAASLPLVGTKVGGIPDLITPDENGLLVPPADPQALAKALDQIAAADLARMGAASRQRVETDFDWDRLAERTAEIYRQVLNN